MRHLATITYWACLIAGLALVILLLTHEPGQPAPTTEKDVVLATATMKETP